MNTIPVIAPNSIQNMTILGDGRKPIFFATLAGHAQTVVIKGETNENYDTSRAYDPSQHISIAWSSKLMKNVQNNKVNVKVMTPAEITEFRRFVNASFQNTSDEFNQANRGLVWVKMLKIDNLSDLDLYVNGPNGGTKEDITKIRWAMATFMRLGIWYQLGQMVAVDLFNGNNDRFDADGQWVNKGNIMFANNALIGLDTYSGPDFIGGASNLDVGGGSLKAMDILSKTHNRSEYAKRITANVGGELAKAIAKTNSKSGAFSMTIKLHDGTSQLVVVDKIPTIFIDQSPEFERGLRDGTEQLRTYLRNKITLYYGVPGLNELRKHYGLGGINSIKNKIGFSKKTTPQTAPTLTPVSFIKANTSRTRTMPQGIIDRMAYLGWL